MGLFSSKEKDLLIECGKTLTQVDCTLAGLASSVDSIHETVQLLLHELENLVPDSEEVNVKRNALSLTKKLLRSVEHSLYNQKMASLRGISLFISMMKEKQDSKNEMIKYMPTLDHLCIDKYIARFQTNGPDGEIYSNVDPDIDEQIIKQENEIEKLKADFDNLKAELEKAIEEKDAKIKELEGENDLLKKDLEILQQRIETIPVQLYCQRSGDLMGHIEQELLKKLNENLKLYKKRLDVREFETSSEIQPNIPVLLLCISTSRLGTDAANALQGVVQIENTALLIFHHKGEHALPNQTSDRVLTGPEFKTLRGIHDLAFLSDKGIYDCDMNSKGITTIIDFICRVTVENVSAKINETAFMSR